MNTYAVLRYTEKTGKESWRTCGDVGEDFGTLKVKLTLFDKLTRLFPKEHYLLVNVEPIKDSESGRIMGLLHK